MLRKQNAILGVIFCAFLSPAHADIVTLPPVMAAIARNGPSPQCALDAERQLTRKERLDASVLGFHRGGEFNPDTSNHIQGIQRYDDATGSYLYVTQNRSAGPGRLVIVAMGSRNNVGAPYGSNREFFEYVVVDFYGPPPAEDRVIDTRSGAGFSSYKHPGGLAIMDNVLAVGLEQPIGDKPKGRVDFYFMDSPTAFRYFNSIETADRKAASVGLTRLLDGRYLVAVPDNSPKSVVLFRSREIGALNSATTFDRIATFSEAQLEPGDNHYFQNVDLIRDCGTGRIYLVLAFRDKDLGGVWANKDRITRYEIINPQSMPSLRIFGRQIINCSPAGEDDLCDLNAGFGAFVGPDGRIIYYATEKEDGGPENSIRFGEFEP